jgi:steroid delta-isomerase-like uncharacterized protein
MLMVETTVTTTHWHGVDPAFALEFNQRLIAAWNSHQPDQLLELMTDDVVYDDASWPTQMHGHAAVRGFLESTWRAVPDLSFELTGGPLVDPAALKTASCWRASATHTGMWDPPGLSPTGRHVSFAGTSVEEFRDGKICRMRVVYDVADILRQLGVLPKPGSTGERVIIALANFQTQLRRR